MVNSDPLIPLFDSKSSETDPNRVKIDEDKRYERADLYSKQLFKIFKDEGLLSFIHNLFKMHEE